MSSPFFKTFVIFAIVSAHSIKKLEEGDWPVYKEVRLRALASDPFVFGSSFERESQWSEAEWRAPLRLAEVAIFVLFDDDEPIGLTGVSVDRDDASKSTAILWGSWLEPEVRGRGLSKMFYEARLKWAVDHPTVQRVIVSHRASNAASKYANQSFGFVRTHITEKLWNDDVAEQELHYELILESDK